MFDFSQHRWQADCRELSNDEKNAFLLALEKTFPDLWWINGQTPTENEILFSILFKNIPRDEGGLLQGSGFHDDIKDTATTYDIREFIAATMGEKEPRLQQIGPTKLVDSDKGHCGDHTGNKYHRKIRDIKGRLCMVFDQDRQEYVFAFVDFYSIERACALLGGGITHCAKKVLFCGIRGKGDLLQDLIEARDALTREIESIKTESAEQRITGSAK